MDGPAAQATICRPMQRSLEKRLSPRYPYILDLSFSELPRADAPPRAAPLLRGRVQNLSRGGLCILCSDPIAERGVLRCEIAVAELPVTIPALVRVCWTQERDVSGGRLAGLQFLY